MSESLEGSCHCGAVGVTVPAASFGVVACHCGDCQKLHGNFFAMVVTDRDQVRWRGEEAIGAYASSERARRTFCSHCGSRLAKDAHGSPKLMLSMGLFDRALARRIRKNVHGADKPAWYELPQEEPA